jgi:hypothetical protein
MNWMFRGKRLDNGNWLYGTLRQEGDRSFILPDNYSVVFDAPEYHYQGMGCGIEDRGITDRYEACEYGWEEAVKRYNEVLPEWVEVIPETAGMGVEIKGKWFYEGDLATAIWYDGDEPTLKLTGEIIFSEGWKCFCIWDGDNKTISELNTAGHEYWTLEKFGNKWDNTELDAGE